MLRYVDAPLLLIRTISIKLPPLIATAATLALKPELWLRRGRFVLCISLPVASHGYYEEN